MTTPSLTGSRRRSAPAEVLPLRWPSNLQTPVQAHCGRAMHATMRNGSLK